MDEETNTVCVKVNSIHGCHFITDPDLKESTTLKCLNAIKTHTHTHTCVPLSLLLLKLMVLRFVL